MTKDEAFAVIVEQSKRILAVRDLIVIPDKPWWGAGIVLENPGKVSLRIFADIRDNSADIEFFSPTHLDEDRTYVNWPFCEDPYNRFALWMVLQARGEDYKAMIEGSELKNLESFGEYITNATDVILESCLPILDGDLSITAAIVSQRVKSPWDSDGA